MGVHDVLAQTDFQCSGKASHCISIAELREYRFFYESCARRITGSFASVT